MPHSKLSIGGTKHYDYDKITLYWTIPNFMKLYNKATKAKDEQQTIAEEKFTLGGKKWSFQLFSEDDEVDIGIYLEFFGPDSASAEYTVYLKSPEGEFINTLSVGRAEYAPQGSDIEGTSSIWGNSWKSVAELRPERFLKDITLNFKINVKIYASKADMRFTVSKDLRNGLESAVGTDVTFIFLEEEGSKNVIGEVKAHKAILSLRSSVFAGMFGSGMKEASEGQVTICDMTPKAFGILLKYIYSGEVDGEWGSVAEELFYGADKYDLAELQSYLCDNVYSVLTARNVWKIRRLASLYKLSQVLKSTMKFFKENAEDVLQNVEDVTLTKKGKSG